MCQKEIYRRSIVLLKQMGIFLHNEEANKNKDERRRSKDER